MLPFAKAQEEGHGHGGRHRHISRDGLRNASTGEGADNSVEKAKGGWYKGNGHEGHRHGERRHRGGSGGGGSAGSGSGGSSSGGFGTASVGPQTQMPSAGAMALTAFTQAMLKSQQSSSGQSQTPSLVQTTLPGGNGESGGEQNDATEAKDGSTNGAASYQSASEAQAEASRDIASCRAAQSQANKCCNNPSSCAGELNSGESKSYGTISNLLNSGPAQGGLTDYCKQMNSLGNDAEKVNVGFSNVCFDSHMECNASCEDLADKYDGLLANCNGCEAQSVYENAQRTLDSIAGACDNLTAKTTQLANNGFSTILNQNMAKYCNQVGGVNAGATATAQAARDGGMPRSPGALAMNCTDSSQPGCKAVKEGHVDGQWGESKVKKNDLAVDAAGGFKGYGNSKPSTQAPQGSGRTVNAKTQAPMAGGKQAASAPVTTQSIAPRTQAPVAKAEDTKKEPEKSKDEKPQIRAPASEEVAPIASNDSQFSGEANLRQFLPGGSRAAGRRMAGGNEINPKEEDIFLRISNKIMEKCRLGILLECR